MKKVFYEQPTTKILVVRVEERILEGSLRVNSVNSGYDEDWDLGEI